MENRTNDELPPAVRNLAIDFLKLLTLLSGGGALLMATALLTYLSGAPKNSFILWFNVGGVYLFTFTLATLVVLIWMQVRKELTEGLTCLPKQHKQLFKSCTLGICMFIISSLSIFLLVFNYCYNLVIVDTKTSQTSKASQPTQPKKKTLSPHQKWLPKKPYTA